MSTVHILCILYNSERFNFSTSEGIPNPKSILFHRILYGKKWSLISKIILSRHDRHYLNVFFSQGAFCIVLMA